MNSADFKITPHRAKILSILRQGAVEDVSGYATPKLREQTGHRTHNALAGVLQQMEQAGLLTRDMNGRRTFRIALTQEGQRLADLLAEETPFRAPQPAPRTSEATAPLDGVDLDLLAGVLLKKALMATQAQEEAAGAKDALRRLAAAEARLAALEEELRAAHNAVAERDAQIKTLEHNNQVLTSQMDKVRRSPGTPIKDLVSKQELRDLEALMRALPSRRDS